MVKQFENRVRKGRYLVPESRQKSRGGYRPSRSTYGYGDSNRNVSELKVLMVEEYSDLDLYVHDEPSEKTGGYKYLVRNTFNSHTAFRTENGLNRFLKRTGLKKELTDTRPGVKSYKLIGKYQRITMAGDYKLLNEFGRQKNLTRTKILDNGEYTTAYYGNGKIYLLNPNYPRTIYNYFWE